jgi:hypothetical protein
MAVVNAFEVAPEADEDFVAEWEAAHLEPAVLLRALRTDVRFRFVSLAQADETPFDAPPGPCEVVHEDGEPDGSQGVTLVEPFDVDDDDRFLAGWHRLRDELAQHRGYLGTRLHRSVADGADLRFVTVARWSSPLMFFRASPAGLGFPSYPALYVAVRDH